PDGRGRCAIVSAVQGLSPVGVLRLGSDRRCRSAGGRAMTDLSNYVFKPLWEDGEFMLSRGVRDGERSPLFVLSSTSEQPTPGSLQRLAHSYALRDELDPGWAARPLALVQHQGRPSLLLEDPGGEPLARLLGQPWGLTQCLRIALGLAGALRQLHARGLIHKDIKPAHILVNPATGAVWLT